MYCVGKILGIIKIVFGWNALMILLKVMKSILTNEQISYNLLSIPVECAKSLVQKGNMWQLWYFIMVQLSRQKSEIFIMN